MLSHFVVANLECVPLCVVVVVVVVEFIKCNLVYRALFSYYRLCSANSKACIFNVVKIMMCHNGPDHRVPPCVVVALAVPVEINNMYPSTKGHFLRLQER